MTSYVRRGPGGGGEAGAGRPVPWASLVGSTVAAVGWAFAAMAAVAALGLHLVGADRRGALGPMTAAVVAMAAGGRVSPSGDVSVLGIQGATATGTVGVLPLGVALAGALPLAWVFLRALRRAGPVVGGRELLARAAAVAVLFVAAVGALAWAGHDTITLDGALFGGADQGGNVSGPGDLGDLGALGTGLADALGRLARARTSVGFEVLVGPSLAGGLLWVAVVLASALLCSRRAPLPPGWAALHRVVRPVASALGQVLLLAVAAGLAAALYAAIGDAHPGRVVGAALLGAPNGVWAADSLGLFVPWHGQATGPLAALLPHPLDTLLGGGGERTVTVAGLAAQDGRVWLLPVAAALMALAAGVLTAVRTPLVHPASRGRFAAVCALRLAVAGAVALPVLGWLTGISVGASLSVLGFDAVGSGVTLHGSGPYAVLLGALWGAAAGAAGALLACLTGAAGRRAAPPALWPPAGGPPTAPAAGPGPLGPKGPSPAAPTTPGTPWPPRPPAPGNRPPDTR